MITRTSGFIVKLEPPFRRVATRTLTLIAAMLLAGCASARFDVIRVPSYAYDQPGFTALGENYAPQLGSAAGQSGFRLLVSGPEAFAARGALAVAALKTLDLQYYIVAHDSTATLLLDGVLRAAQRGVRVRLLVDDLNVGDRESDLALLAAHANVEVRLFNPFAQRGGFGFWQVLEMLGDSERLNRRMHNKLWIADNALAVMGGRNLGDAYFNASPDSNFADLDVLAAGPVVGEMSSSFDLYWNSESAVPIAAITGPAPPLAELQLAWAAMGERAQHFRDSDYVRALRATAFGGLVRNGKVSLVVARAHLLADVPMEPGAAATTTATATTSAIFPQLRQVVEQARREVLLVSPYLVPGARSVEVLCGVARRGVRVKILTNSLASTDVPVVHAGYARYRPQMLACGFELFELRPNGPRAKASRIGLSSGASLHTKAIAVDGEVVFIGSMNLDPRSKHLNSEVALRIDSRELGQQLVTLFDEATTLDQAFRVGLDEPGNAQASLHWDAIENDSPVHYAREPLASAWRRWVSRLLGGLAPEDML
ncbi:MAG: phospholipase D family protein [Pseudomonadota bacterium]|nr:phospholipase D family protein [Pseudomonadota bacterium]